MAKEGELKRVDLKVNVSCCDGCRRKVVKALGVKGVMRTEIHPSLAAVTVVGDVDIRLLIKKLAKIGKISEVAALPPDEDKKCNGGSDKKGENNKTSASQTSKCKVEGEKKPADAAAKQECNKCTQEAECTNTSDKKQCKDAIGKGQEEAPVHSFGARSSVCDATTMNYHRAEPMAVPMHPPYYATNSVTYYGYYTMPSQPMAMVARQPPLLRSQPSRFDEDFFNDDNTAGCRVM